MWQAKHCMYIAEEDHKTHCGIHEERATLTLAGLGSCLLSHAPGFECVGVRDHDESA